MVLGWPALADGGGEPRKGILREDRFYCLRCVGVVTPTGTQPEDTVIFGSEMVLAQFCREC